MAFKRIAFIALIFFFCTALAGAGLLVALSTPVGLDAVRQTIERYGHRFINGRISIGRLHGNLWKRLVVQDISVALPDSLGGEEVAGADQVTFSINFWRLFAGRFVIPTLTIDGGRLNYIEADGRRQTDTITALLSPYLEPAAPEPETATRIPVPEIHITRGSLFYLNPADSTSLRANNVFLRGRLRDTRHLSARIGVQKALYTFGGYQDSVATFYTSVQLDGDTLRVHDLTMETAPVPLFTFRANGVIAPASPFPVSLSIAGNGDASVITRMIGVESRLGGDVTLTGSLRNTLRDPVVEARLASPELDTDIGRFTQAAMDFRYARDVLAIDRYTGNTDAGRVSGQGLLDFSQPRTQYRLTINAESLILERLPDMLVDPGFPLRGKAVLKADIAGAGFRDPELTGTLTASVPSLRVSNKTLGAVSASVEYNRGRVRLSVRTPMGTAETSGILRLNGETDLNTRIAIPQVAAFVALFGDSSTTGAAELQVGARGSVARPEISMTGRIDRLGYAGIPLGTLELTGSLDADLTARIEAAIDTSKIRFSAQTDLAGDTQPLEGVMTVRAFQLRDHLSGHDPGWDLDGVIEVEGELGGTLFRPEFRGNGLLHQLSIRGEHLGDTSLSLTVSDQDVSFTVVSSDFSVFSNGIVRLTDGYPYDVRLDLEGADLTPMLAILAKRPIERQTGLFTGRMKATGLAAYPDLSTITMSLDSMFVSIDDRELHFAAPSTIRLDRQIVTIDRFELSGDFGHILINGIASLARDGLLELEGLVENVQLNFLSPFLLSRGNLGGQVNAQFSLTGAPDAPVLSGAFTTANVSYNFNDRQYPLGTVTAEVQYKDRRLEIPYLSIDTPLGSSHATLVYPVDLRWGGETSTPVEHEGTPEEFNASMIMDHLAIGPLREFFPSIPPDLDGLINGRIELEGPISNPGAFTGTVHLDSLYLASIQYELVTEDAVRMQMHRGIVHVDTIRAVMRQLDEEATPSGRIRLGGQIALKTREDDTVISDFALYGQDIAIESLLSLTGSDLPLSGTLDGNVILIGPYANQSVEGRIQLGRIQYNQAKIDTATAHFLFDRGVITLYEFQMWTGDDTLFASGTIPFDTARDATDAAPPREMALTVQGHDIDLQFLQGVTYGLERIAGKADVQLRIGGPRFSPKSVGEIVIRDPVFQIRNIKPPLQTSVMRFNVDGDQIVLQPVEIKAGGGRIALDNRFLIRNFSLDNFNMEAAFDNADIEIVGSARLNVNGGLRLEGNATRSRLSSQSLVLRGTVTHPLTLSGILLGDSVVRPGEAPSPFLERMAMNVEIDVPQLRVRNRIADIEAQGGLAMTGSAQNPIITGNALANENGKIVYLDTQFDVTSGRLEFVRRTPLESFSALLGDPIQELDPEVSIQAEARNVKDIYGTRYDVSLNVSGRATQPNLQLTAVPIDAGAVELQGTLAGPEVVSLLTFGLPGLSTGGGNNTFSGLGNRALLMATGNQAERLLRLDEVRIEGDILSGNDTGTPAQITLSKRINRRTEVTFTRLFDSSDFRLRIGYQLSKLLFIETESDQISERPQTGMDIKIKFRFR